MTQTRFGTRAVALMTALALAVPSALVGTPASAYSFSNLKIEGTNRVDPATVISFANIPRGTEISAGQLNDAVQRLQQSGLFETVEMVPQGSTLVIRVAEYPTIGVISIEGNKRLKDAVLSAAIASQSRRVYSPSQAEEDAAAIAQLYAADGRYAARVDPRIIRRGGNRVDLVFMVREGAVTEIERVGFSGNRAFSDRRLRQVLATKQAGLLRAFIKRDTFDPGRSGLDEKLLTDFYRSRGYADFKVQAVAPEIARERDAFFVTYAIEEGPRFRFGRVNVVSEIAGVDARPFVAQNRVRAGSVYNPQIIDTSIQRMEAVASQQGLDFATIEPRITRNPSNQTLDLTLALVRGPRVFVERIDIEGNTTTLDEVIRRQFRTVEGDPFNPREIRNAAERIRALGYFADAQVESRQGSSEQQVIVDVNVEEQPTGSLTFGGSYGANAGFGATVSLSEDNFLGRGQQVALSFSTGKDNRNLSFNFVEPYLLGRDLRWRLSGFYRTSDRENATYKSKSIGASTGVEFPVSQRGRLELRYSVAQIDIIGVDPLVVTPVPVPGEPDAYIITGSSPLIEADAGKRLSSAIGYSYSYDSRRERLDPRTAWKLNFSQDYSGLGGDVKSVRTGLSAGIESNAWRESVSLRLEAEAGAVTMLDDQVSRIAERFKGSALRGFDSNGYGPRDSVIVGGDERRYIDSLGGNYYWVARAEAAFPIGLPEEYGIKGGVFADVGSVWGLDDTFGAGGEVDDSMRVRASVGVSMFWTTPVGPLRLNFAKAVKKEDYDETQVFDLTVSTQF